MQPSPFPRRATLKSTLEAAAKEIGEGTLAIQSDAGKVAEIEAAMKKIKERFGRIDAPYVNAGVGQFVPFEQITEKFFDETVNINYEGSLIYRLDGNPVNVQRLGGRAERVDQRTPGHAGDHGVRRNQSGRSQHGQNTLDRSTGKRHSGQCHQPGPDCIYSELNTHPAYPLSTLRCAPRDTQRKTRGRADRYSFPVRLFHPLLHSGLARRTEMARF